MAYSRELDWKHKLLPMNFLPKEFKKEIDEILSDLEQLKKGQPIQHITGKAFFYNDFFAKSQIIELTITDPAYYKNNEDFTKRFKGKVGRWQ